MITPSPARWRLWIVGGLITFSTGCGPYLTHNIARPMVVRKVPDAADLNLPCGSERASADDRARSLSLLAQPNERTGINTYSGDFVYTYLGRIRESLALCPENPYAWSLMGVYLALQHQPLEAIRATDRALAPLDARLDRGQLLASPLAELYRMSQINLASYQYLSGFSHEALRTLARLDQRVDTGAVDLPTPERILKLRIEVQALTLADRGEDAREVLAKLRPLAAEHSTAWRNLVWELRYPQIFEGDRREAVNLYLDGLVALHSGRSREARTALRRAIHLDPQRWEAHFSLAEAYAASEGGLPQAIEMLETLADQLDDSKEFVRTEVLLYNLALTCLDAGEPECAEKSLRAAIEEAEQREVQVIEQLNRALLAPCRVPDDAACGSGRSEPPEQCRDAGTAFLLAAIDPCRIVFSPAELALGDLLRNRTSAAAPSGDARQHFLRALDDPRLTAADRVRAYAGLAELALARDDREAFLLRTAQGLLADPTHQGMLDLLARETFRGRDPDFLGRAASLLLDALVRGSRAEPFLDRDAGGVPLGARLEAELLAAERESETARAAYARLLIATGRESEAQALYLAEANRDPDALWPWAGLLRLHPDQLFGSAATDWHTRSLQWLERGVGETTAPDILLDSLEVWIVSGQRQMESGDLCGARREFARALELAPTHPFATQGLALVEAEVGSGGCEGVDP